jgi:hypothetical protein
MVEGVARMRAPVRYIVLIALLVAACGREIGDSCIVSSDCSPQGDRQCDTLSTSGYCTIMGCDFNTCPSEAVCVRFFTGNFSNTMCDPTQPNVSSGCSLDELCTLTGNCVPRAAEIRYCMRKCNKESDCRSSYECRDLGLMKAHGGEPVLAPGVLVDQSAPKFCASAPAAM